MTVRLGSNIGALQAQRRLAQNSAGLVAVFERLSSGQRINRASDDAASLAIANRLAADRRLFTQAIANLNDGVSALRIADSSLEQRGSILQRLNELAEQAANGTLSFTQRGSLSSEYRDLVQELGRLRNTSSFNGLSLLGSDQRLNLQVGINGNTNSLIEIEGVSIGGIEWVINSDELFSIADWNGDSGVDDLDSLAFNTTSSGSSLAGLQARFGSNWVMSTIVDAQGVSRTIFIGAAYGADGLALLSYTSDSSGTVFSADQRNRAIFDQAFSAGVTDGATVQLGGYTLSDNLGGTFVVDSRGIRVLSGQSLRPSGLAFSGVESVGRARAALELLATELLEVATQRSKIGAGESRLQSTWSLLQAARENSAAAESRLRDADMAAESAQLARLKILQEVGASVLRSASLQPQIALSLL